MATPTGITLVPEAAIVEIVETDYGNTKIGGSQFGGGVARVIGSEWTADPAPPAVDDYIQYKEDGTTLFIQDDVTYCFVPKENYLFIQAAPP